MNKRIISFICAGLVATSCVSSLCFYDYFANDGTTSNLIYWIFDFFQLSILLGQAGIGVYTINVLLRQRKEAISSLGYFAAHVFLQNITLVMQVFSYWDCSLLGHMWHMKRKRMQQKRRS